MNIEPLRLLVVIVNYKTPSLVCDAIASLQQQLAFARDHIVVVDNDSSDGSLEKIQAYITFNSWDGSVTVIDSGHNGGFSAGNNVGLKFKSADYYLLLNSDAYVRDGAIGKLLDAANNNSCLGVVGPRLEWTDGSQQTSCFYNASPINSFLHASQTGIFTRLFSYFKAYDVAMPLRKHGSDSPDWLSFACVLLNGDMVNKIGLMDDGFFMYYEDIDYCRRAKMAGWELEFVSAARVVHLNLGDSNHAVVRRFPLYYFQSRARYFLKYYGRFGLLITNILWSLGRSISYSRELFERKPAVFHKSMWLDIWAGFLQIVK
jgi:N-acetylglucosaminyl-diphospho-decaprenol L-rhamnosyltransferase